MYRHHAHIRRVCRKMTYPDRMQVRWVKAQGDISWKGHHIYLTSILAGELIGLQQRNDDLWDIYFGPIRLAQLDTNHSRLIHLPRKITRRHVNRKDNGT
jgi:hypothetical protein